MSPFSLTEIKVADEWSASPGRTIKIYGYKKGRSPRVTKDVWISGNTASTATFSGWDGLIKVEIAAGAGNMCVDDIKLKT